MNILGRQILEFLKTQTMPWEAELIAGAVKADLHAVMSVLETLRGEGLADLKRDLQGKKTVFLNAEGRSYYTNGTPERRLANAVKKEGALDVSQAVSQAGLSKEEQQVAFKWASQEGLVKFEKSAGQSRVRFLKEGRTLTEEALDALGEMQIDEGAVGKEFIFNLRQRHLLEEREDRKKVFASITAEGRKALSSGKPAKVTQLTPSMLKDGSWKNAAFQEYDLQTAAVAAPYGGRQPYLRFVRQIKDALSGLGFQESEGPIAELEFWNMDALFMPQDHPARDIHDVFELDVPEGKVRDKELWAQVRKAHEEGLRGSKGWGYSWSERMARRVVLRSQTTTVSARHLARKMKPPFKIFCIGSVFRPDEIDWKHFIEFNQCEGIVADENMSFCELLGYLRGFAVDIFGAQDVRFVPSYFPFTEPSVEMYAKVQDKWTEVGGAGMFRPEMLAALGCEVPVLAWGLGLDRLAMKKLGITDIRELLSQDLNYLRKS